jgi:Cellulase (glycosyl hydrolase family 5)
MLVYYLGCPNVGGDLLMNQFLRLCGHRQADGFLRRILALFAFLLIGSLIPANAYTARSKARATLENAALSISVSGNLLVNGSGRPVFLHGINRDDAAYSCTSKHGGIHATPPDQSSVDRMKQWNINAVRLPLNEDCWLGINGVRAAYSGTNYIMAIVSYVRLLQSNNIYVILDLHWNAPGAYLSDSQEPMADSDHAPAFWSSVARSFANNRAVLFDLYNEPYPSSQLSWSCWANGGCNVKCSDGSCKGTSFAVAGMGQMLTAVRNAEGSGWHHPVLMGGLGSASDLTGWLANHPDDPAHQLVANAHAYNDHQSCQDPSDSGCLDTTWKSIIQAGYPLTLDEFGQTGCVWIPWLDDMMTWMETRGSSGYLAWGWDGGAACSDPGLINSWAGDPNSYGLGYKTHLLTLK